MKRDDYIHGAMRIRVLEKQLIQKPLIERMIAADSIEEALKILGETEYGGVLGKLEHPSQYDEALTTELVKAYKEVAEAGADETLNRLMQLKYFYHNLKVLMKEKILGEDLSDNLSPIPDMDIIQYRGLVADGGDKVAKELPLQAIATVEADYEKNKDPQRIDVIFDAYYFRDLSKTAKEVGSRPLEDYVANLIDLTNLKTVLRVRLQNQNLQFLEEVLADGGNIPTETLISLLNAPVEEIKTKLAKYSTVDSAMTALDVFGKTGSLTDFEKAVDDFMTDFAHEASKILYGPEVMFGFLAKKETEIKNLRIILVSKLNRISESVLRERLREIYV